MATVGGYGDDGVGDDEPPHEGANHRQHGAEREGFEPSRGFTTPNRLAGDHLRPLGHLSNAASLAHAILRWTRSGRDSNPRASRPAAFKAAALVRSATAPQRGYRRTRSRRPRIHSSALRHAASASRRRDGP